MQFVTEYVIIIDEYRNIYNNELQNGYNMKILTCCFFGHRNTTLTKELYEELKRIIEDLIVNENVQTFLFGSRSDFDFTCHKIVTELKNKYPFIIRKCYTCRNETCILESERGYWEEVYSHIRKEKVTLLGVEEEVEHKTKYTSGRASYVERNKAMINNSDYCIFYYDESYKPEMRKYSKTRIDYYQPKSGTKLAYNYAKQKRKIILNLVKL